MADLALTMARLITALGLERVTLMGTSWGGTLALWLAVRQPERLDALVPEAPGAIRPEGHTHPRLPPGQLARLSYAHPERRSCRGCAGPIAAPISNVGYPACRRRRWCSSARSTG